MKRHPSQEDEMARKQASAELALVEKKKTSDPEVLARARSLDMQAKDALRDSAEKYMEMCRCLHEIQRDNLYLELGFESFQDYVEVEFKASYSWVRQRIKVYKALLAPGAPDEVRQAAWSGRINFSKARKLSNLEGDQQVELLVSGDIKIPGSEDGKKFDSLTARELDLVVRAIKYPEQADDLATKVREEAEEKARRKEAGQEDQTVDVEFKDVTEEEPAGEPDVALQEEVAELRMKLEEREREIREKEDLLKQIEANVQPQNIPTVMRLIKFAIKDITKKFLISVQEEEGIESLEEGPDGLVNELSSLIEDGIQTLLRAIDEMGLETVCLRLQIPLDD